MWKDGQYQSQTIDEQQGLEDGSNTTPFGEDKIKNRYINKNDDS